MAGDGRPCSKDLVHVFATRDFDHVSKAFASTPNTHAAIDLELTMYSEIIIVICLLDKRKSRMPFHRSDHTSVSATQARIVFVLLESLRAAFGHSAVEISAWTLFWGWAERNTILRPSSRSALGNVSVRQRQAWKPLWWAKLGDTAWVRYF